MNRGRFGRMDALILADQPPATLVERTQARLAQERRGAQAQHRLLGEAMAVLLDGGHGEAAGRLGDLRVVFALGPAYYGKVIAARLPGVGIPSRGAIGGRQ